jgi:hypothetical protein
MHGGWRIEATDLASTRRHPPVRGKDSPPAEGLDLTENGHRFAVRLRDVKLTSWLYPPSRDGIGPFHGHSLDEYPGRRRPAGRVRR